MWQIFTSKLFRVPGIAMCACNSRTIFWNSYSKGLVHNILTKMYNSGSKWERLLVFELWEDEPLMSCRLCHFPNGEGENIGEILCFGVRCQTSWRPSLVGSLVYLLIPIGPLFQLQYNFVKPIRGPQKSVNIFVRPSNMFCQKSIRVWTRSFWNHIGEC